MAVAAEKKKGLIEEHRTHAKDTGSPEVQIAMLTESITQLTEHLRQHLVEEFGLEGQARMWLEAAPQEGGSLRVNTLAVDALPWSGIYFQGVPVRIEALPEPGYEFAGWSDSTLPDTSAVSVDLAGDYRLTARFASQGSGVEAEVPAQLLLAQNYPNPFNRATNIPYRLPAAATVRLAIYDLSGQLLRRLVEAQAPAGTYRAVWDGRDEAGQPVASGVYLCQLRAGQRVEARKMVLLE